MRTWLPALMRSGSQLLCLALLGCCFGLLACHGAPAETLDAAPSPQASAEPAPLANVGAAASAAATTTSGVDGSVSPEALRGDREVPVDTPHEVPRELLPKDFPKDPKELAGYELQVVLHMGEGPPAVKAPEVNGNAIDAARHKTEAHMVVDVSQTRARLSIQGGFVLPERTELRARSDRYGHVLLWPGEDTYRVAEPGAMRALFGERRLDVAPVSPVETRGAGDGARRLGYRTRRVELSTRAAKATFELATLPNASEGGALVCRWLLDLMGGPPAASPCANDEVPLHAELRWTTQGSLAFDVTALARRTDLAVQDMAAPPARLAFVRGAVPVPPGEAMLGKADLAAMRNGPIDVPVTRALDAQAPAPDAGLVLANLTDGLRVAWLDGVPVAWVAPGGSVLLPSLVRGKYVLQWRSFLGDAWDGPQTAVVPGRSDLGSVETGAR
jgi:hypothetical protein